MTLYECEIVSAAVDVPEDGGTEKVLMAIYFPQNLVVADNRGVQVRDSTPMASRGDNATVAIAVPIRWITEGQRPEPHQGDTACPYVRGAPSEARRQRRIVVSQGRRYAAHTI